MNKSTGNAFESLGTAAKNLSLVMQLLEEAPDPDMVDAYMRAQKAIDEMTIFLTANLQEDYNDISAIIESE